MLTVRQIHGDTEATLQCVLCLRAKVDVRKSYHCSTDCFRKHWHLHRDLHGQPAQRNGANLLGMLSSQVGWQPRCCLLELVDLHHMRW